MITKLLKTNDKMLKAMRRGLGNILYRQDKENEESRFLFKKNTRQKTVEKTIKEHKEGGMST